MDLICISLRAWRLGLKNGINNFQEYINYCELKANPAHSSFQVKPINGIEIKNILLSPLRNKFQTCISEAFLTVKEFYENLRNKRPLCVAKIIQQSPQSYYSSLTQGDLENLLEFYQAVSTLVAYDLFYYPPLRAILRKIFLEKVKLSTQPKIVSDSPDDPGIHMYNPNYCVKRIRNRPFVKFRGNVNYFIFIWQMRPEYTS